ncbi:ATP-dependent RNA helicase vasa: isoform A-like protein [Leptotrombidium deliense]|uniref:RNA helicase n=1 Tax=Leptotrombidium deliense TaxID=299467 RepID=A0A443SVR7_9ACAR|nr:ATP-dependent RNA helicase vasa: isoform A-like protein [Leptotrombidium deliense]
MSDDWDESPSTTVTESMSKAAVADDWGDDWSASNNTTNNGASNGAAGDDWTDGGNSWGGSSESRKPMGRGSGGGGKTCFKCQQSGHMSRECPNAGSGGGGPRKCFNCDQEGHNSRDCPEPRKERAPRTCNNCKKEGHMSRDCTEPRRMECHKCGKEGHMSRECTESGSSDRKCYNCQQPGHTSRDCTEPRKPREPREPRNGGDTNGDASDGNAWGTSWDTTDATASESKPRGGGGGSGCRRCGKEGHKAADCQEEVLGEDGKPRPPAYKNEDLREDDESIYDTITSGINFDRYDKIPVNVTGFDGKPLTAFTDAIDSETLLGAIEKCHYTRPTPVQKYGIPIVLAKKDLMACAQTGSGKTAAFLLPIIQDMLRDKELPSMYGQSVQSPVCVVISPTRELALQIYGEAFKFTKGSIVKPQIIYGGTSAGHQLAQISRGTHILVATPGRLNDFLTKGKISFDHLKFLILDEADRMIDQGFIPEVRKMVSDNSMPEKGKRQTLMFSATFPDEVQRLAAEFLSDDYVFLTVGIVGAANTDVDQSVMKVEKYEKRQKLTELLGSTDIKDRTMIFVEQKKTADFLASFLSQSSYKATSIHGDRFQRQREEALIDFKTGRMPILVATSVASRGLDIKDVRHVINYDLPKEIDDYVHRIGRTGRVGNVGKSTSFYDPSVDRPLAKSLVKILQGAQQQVPEWLSEEGEGSYAPAARTDFGGTDIRKGQKTFNSHTSSNDDWSSTPAAAPTGEAEESWD